MSDEIKINSIHYCSNATVVADLSASLLIITTPINGQLQNKSTFNKSIWEVMLFIVFIISAGLLFPCISFADIDSNLVGYWKLDDGCGTAAVDSSGNNNTGTLTNGPLWCPGKFVRALSFDGTDDYVNINDSPSLQFGTGSFTIALYVKFPINGSYSWDGIITKGYNVSGPAKSWGLVRGSSASNEVWFIVESDTAVSASIKSPILSAGWRHIAIVKLNNSLSMYIDGASVNSAWIPFTPNLNGTDPLTLGNAGGRYVNTTMDEVRIYKRALSAEDVLELYNFIPPEGADSQPPSIPTGIDADAISYSQVNLSWTAATDNSGCVSGYKIYRNGAQIGSSIYNAYSDTTTLPRNAYSYTVAAYDWAGNVSAQSSPALATTPGSGIVNAASCEQADVKIAVDAACDGDTVFVPAGNALWNNGLVITKGIYLCGAGIGNTVITSNYIAGFLVTYNPSDFNANYPFRLSGFTFDLADKVRGSIDLGIWGKNAPFTPQTKVRVDHNRFMNGLDINVQAIWNRGSMMRGVVDNNIFDSIGHPIRSDPGDSGSWWENFTLTFGLFGDNLYFEDNTFRFPASTMGILSDCQWSGRYLFRYNTIISSGTAGYYALLDMHGNQNGGSHSCFGGEVYGNLIDGSSFGKYNGAELLKQRGGKALVFCNNIISLSPSGVQVWEEYSDFNDPPATSPDGQTQHVSDTYFWNNRGNNTTLLSGYIPTIYSGTATGAGANYLDDTTKNFQCGLCNRYGVEIYEGTGAGQYRTTQSISSTRVTVSSNWNTIPDATSKYRITLDCCNVVHENSEFFNQKTAFDGTAGMGCGTLANRPVTCTPGVGYWATNQNCNDLTGMVGAHPSNPISGTLYKCTAPDTWTAYYTPLAYPHPLAVPPGAPASVRDGTGADRSFTSATTVLSANWDVCIDTYSGITRYWYTIGTTAGATNVTNGWLSNDTNITVTKTGLSLTIGTTYYFNIKAENGMWLQSSTATSNGQYISSLPDTTPPSAPSTVRDGTGIDVNTTTSTAQLSANWTDAADNESGIANYQYAIGTAPGAMNITNGWILSNTNTNITKTGLILTIGATYYFSVKAENGVGLQSSVTTSNGQYVTETIVEPPSTGTIITSALVYPNPVDFRQGNLTFKAVDNAGAEVKIYTTSGRLVKKLAIENGENNVEWDGTNEADEKVIRGGYIYTITQNNGDKLTGKLAVR